MPEPRLRAATKETKGRGPADDDNDDDDVVVTGIPSVEEKAAGSVRPEMPPPRARRPRSVESGVRIWWGWRLLILEGGGVGEVDMVFGNLISWFLSVDV